MFPLFVDFSGFRDRSNFGEKATRICSWGRYPLYACGTCWHVEDWTAASGWVAAKMILCKFWSRIAFPDICPLHFSPGGAYIVLIDVPIIQAATKLCNARLIRIDNNRGGALIGRFCWSMRVCFIKASTAKWKSGETLSIYPWSFVWACFCRHFLGCCTPSINEKHFYIHMI